MALFHSAQKQFKNLGLYSSHSIQSSPFGVKNVSILLLIIVYLLLMIMYIVDEAQQFEEYAYTCYACGMGVIIIISFVTVIWNVNTFFTIIKNFEEFIQESECHSSVF